MERCRELTFRGAAEFLKLILTHRIARDRTTKLTTFTGLERYHAVVSEEADSSAKITCSIATRRDTWRAISLAPLRKSQAVSRVHLVVVTIFA